MSITLLIYGTSSILAPSLRRLLSFSVYVSHFRSIRSHPPPLRRRRKTRHPNRRNRPISNRNGRRAVPLRSPPGIHPLPIHLRQSRRPHLRQNKSPMRQRPPSRSRANAKTPPLPPPQSRPPRSQSPRHERSSPQNHRRHRPHPRASRKNVRRRASRAPRFRPRHRRLDRRNVPNLQSRPPRRPTHPRPGSKKRLVSDLRQKTHAQAQRTPSLRRTLAPLSHHSQLVHVASIRARRPRHHQQNPKSQSKNNKAPQAHHSRNQAPQTKVALLVRRPTPKLCALCALCGKTPVFLAVNYPGM